MERRHHATNCRCRRRGYQTLHNYYPAKATILHEILLNAYVGPGPAINDVITHSGDLLETLDNINHVRIQSFSRENPVLLSLLSTSFAKFDESADATRVETIDKAGDGYYYAVEVRQLGAYGR